MQIKMGWNKPAAAVAFCTILAIGPGFILPAPAQAAGTGVSAACGSNFQPNRVTIDGDVNTPVQLSASQIKALPGQKTINIAFLNRLNVLEAFSETGPTLWTALNIAAGGIKLPPPTPNQLAGEPARITTLFVVVVGTDGYETLISEGEIDPGFGNSPILLGIAEDGVVLANVPPSSPDFKGPAQLVVPTDIHGGRYANQICRITVINGSL